MIKPNWNVFKAKFSENPQSNFEWLCYLLFCNEFDRPMGIFRYKNQSGIETDPILFQEEVIGWQAKLYETTLSDHRVELMETINKSKRDYPNLSKLIIFSNQEWGQGRGKNDPQAKVEAEKKANEFNIVIEWRTASYFESPFVVLNNADIIRHFFTMEKSIVDEISDKQKHAESILYEIQTDIIYNQSRIVIDRSELLQKINTDVNKRQVIIICGVGGSGKTAVIKKLYSLHKDNIPFYIFKASEFEINNINNLFGSFGLQGFMSAHNDEEHKIIVIDSAEKLLELDNTDPFKELFSALIQSNWKIIFTARSNYLQDLDIQFIDNYQLTPYKFYVETLKQEELGYLADEYKFNLPVDFKLLELIENPFYLKEYLKFYNEEENINYVKFKEKLWNKIIKKASPSREQCFINTAYKRANENHFFVTPNLNETILDTLVADGILGYETAGYFITHDIYEEWALEKIINSEFIKKENVLSFFSKIGDSLPIRRSFRNWVSEMLLLENESVKEFIEEIINDEDVNYFWKDEVIISVLLSHYSATFFNSFKEMLLDGDRKLLHRISFLLRISCKEIDSEYFNRLGLQNKNLLSIKYVFTKPKGSGWESLIKFVYENIDEIGIGNIFFVLPIIHEWNSKFKVGETTKNSSLVALKYYQWIIKEEIYFHRNEDVKDKILQTILYGSSEIKQELIGIFDEILINKWKNHSDPYYDLVQVVLTKLGDNTEVIKILPEYILNLGDLFWSCTNNEDDVYHLGIGVEKYFCIDERIDSYFPPSAYQSPIYWLFQSGFHKTIDFILEFTNKTVECFAKSEFAKYEVETIDVYIEDGKFNKQYISNRLWNSYRGTQVAPHILESMHMALEKWFLEIAKIIDPKVLEQWLFYLLKNSKSASITGVVVSIVIAYPNKTFNVAKYLFRTKEFFFYDTNRMMLDQTAESHYSIGYGLNYEDTIFQDERINTCEDEHRSKCLEHIALQYQFFRSEEVSDEEAVIRQKTIWDIFDEYYLELSEKSSETENDKTWRLYLARMDSRKMKPTTEEKDGEIWINFNPEMDPILREYSEQSVVQSSDMMKHTSLKLWAHYRMRDEEQFKQYIQYEENPQLAINEVKEIVDKLRAISKSQYSKDESFYLLNHTIPGVVCSVLIRDFTDSFSSDERNYCKDIILEAAASSFRQNYKYQISDGVESAISVLPILLIEFPGENQVIKTILLITLFDPHNIGAYAKFSDFSTRAILNILWETNFEDAQSILLGYLFLVLKYEESRKQLRKENYKKNIYEIHEYEVIEAFVNDNETDLIKVVDNNITINDIKDIEQLNLYLLNKAFQLIPLGTDNQVHFKVAQDIISIFANELLSYKREDKVDYSVKHDFLEKLAHFILSSSDENIPIYLKPFIDNFNSSEAIADLLREFISAEDKLHTYKKFWLVWSLFYKNVIEISNNGEEIWYTEKILKSYLFAQNRWKESANEWISLKDENKKFFGDIAKVIGHCPSVLYSLSKLLNNIGSKYLNNGVIWISEILKNNKDLWTSKLEVNTIYYLESLVKNYIHENRERIRKTRKLKLEVFVILDFLVEKGSVVGYMLRENLL